MKKKIRFRSPLLNFFVTVSCLSLSTLFLWLFWQDLNSSGVRTDKDSIAVISFKYNVAQRKFSDRVAWERIQQNTPIYNGDFIRTGEFAQVTINFKDGTSLDVYENSMVQLAYSKENGIQLSVDGGDIQVSSSTAEEANLVAVNFADGSTVNMEKGASLSAKADAASGKQNIEVKDGEAVIKTENGQSATLSTGEAVKLEKGEEIQKAVVSITMIKPTKESRILNFEGGKIPVQFEWHVNGENKDGVTLQTSTTRDFSKIAYNRTIKDATSAKISADNGILYWRAFTESPDDNVKEGRISIEKVPAVEQISPESGSEFRYIAEKPKITFRWNGSNYADTYRLTVSRQPDLSTPVFESETSDSFLTLDNLDAGSYYWAVTPYYPVNNTGWGKQTKTETFTVAKEEYLKKPELTVPADGAELTWRENFNANFMWKSEIEAKYDVLISYDREFSDIAYMERVPSPRFSKEFAPGELKDGTYWWKVVRHSQSDLDRYNESDVRKFTVTRYIPKESKLIYPENDFTCEEEKLSATNFTWNLSDDWKETGISVLQIAADSEFNDIKFIRAQRETTLSGVTLTEGEYWWRIGAQSESGKLIRPTYPRHFSVISPLGMPVFTTPAKNQELLAFDASPVTLSWTGVKNADSYSLKIISKNNEVVYEKTSLKERSVEVNLGEGRYTGRIQAVSGSTNQSRIRTGAACVCDFSVRKPMAVKLIAPENNEHIPGLAAVRAPVTFSWQQGKEVPKSYVLVVSKQQEDGTYRPVQTIDTAQRTQNSLRRLGEGNYKWQIKAVTQDGHPINSEENAFVIDKITPLSQPVLKVPAQEILLGSAFFRSNRSVTFSWLPVDGATDYTFTLSKRNPDGSLKELRNIKNMRETSFILRDFSILDVGRFEWSVTAYTRAKDGFVERESHLSKNYFTIDFGIPETIESIKPETMYAE